MSSVTRLQQPHETAVADAEAEIEALCTAARQAARELAAAPRDTKDRALRAAAQALRGARDDLLDANAADLETAEADGRPESFLDRLRLDEARIEAMAIALEDISALTDPVGRILHSTRRPNGLVIDRVAVPIGVIGMIYESRPNVGADAGALCLKSGNAVILRGGSESRYSSRVIVDAMRDGLTAAGLPAAAVQCVRTRDRRAVAALLRATEGIDLVIPRGGRGLVELVRDQARVPTLLHLDGNCHTYVHAAADLDMAVEVVRNAKLRRTGVCGATESLVVDRKIVRDLVPRLVEALDACELRGDAEACAAHPAVRPATLDDWDAEYLDRVLSIRTVGGIDEALDVVAAHSSGHTDAIVTADTAIADRFLAEVDSAIVMHNTSTQFADGGEFGMGAEIGIATGRLHARGPVGLEQLTTFKYQVRGEGQIRP